MTNERTLTTNKILVGNGLIEEYLFDETKKAELEKGLKNLVNNLKEMIEAEDVYECDRIIKVSEVLEASKDYNFSNNDMLEVADGLFAYPEENGDGYILDAEDFKGELINDTTTHCQVTNCYYWRNENNKIQIEAVDFKNDPDQHKRQVEAGHHVIYDTMYLIAPYFKTYFGEL